MKYLKQNYPNMFTTYKDVVNVNQLAEMLGIGITLAYRLVKQNTIKSIKVGRQYKIPKQMKQKTNKQRKLEDSRYSIIQQDLSKCYFCNNKSKDWHELIKGRNRKKCIKTIHNKPNIN